MAEPTQENLSRDICLSSAWQKRTSRRRKHPSGLVLGAGALGIPSAAGYGGVGPTAGV